MRLIFLRHGEKVRGGKDTPLTQHGCHQATLAGKWLRDAGHRPTHVLTTKMIRTVRTAELALAEAMPDGCVVMPPRSGMAVNPVGWDRLTADLAARLGADTTVLLVGHEPTQDFIERTWTQDRPAPQHNHCAMFVIEGEAGGAWRCVEAFEGVAD